jgi:RNA polymerase sigma-70 factor (ECF subfamily)
MMSTRDSGGVPPSFAEMYRTHLPRLRRALELAGLDKDSAEDMAQEAFARTFYHWARVAKGNNPPGYAYRVAFNLAKRHWKARSRMQGDPRNSSPAANWEDQWPQATRQVPIGSGGSQGVEETVVTSLVAVEVLSKLPKRQRACAVLCLFAGLSTKEAARALGITQGTVRKQLAHARKAFALALGPKPPAPDASPHRRSQPSHSPPLQEGSAVNEVIPEPFRLEET